MMSLGDNATRRRRGFSLLELVLVVSILAILASLAAPRYANALSRYPADRAARRVAADLDLARNHARISGASKTVVFIPADEEYQITGVKDLKTGASDYEVDLSAGPYHSDLVSADFGGDANVVFDAYGVPDGGGQVVIRAGSFQKTVVLNADSGKAQVQ